MQPLSVAVTLTVNGQTHALEVLPHHTLLETLRDGLGLTGTKECCGEGECGACTVLVNGRAINSCLMLAAEADGETIVTIEGLCEHTPTGGQAPLGRASLAGPIDNRPPVGNRPHIGPGPLSRLDPLQTAFLEKGAAQCGFCIPGMIMAARYLLMGNPHPTVTEIQDGLAGNLCRCGGYSRIIESVAAAAEAET